MRLASAVGSSWKASPRRMSNSQGFFGANTETRHRLDDDLSCGSDHSYPGLQLHIPHMEKQQTASAPFQYTSGRPTTTATIKQKRLEDEEASMLRFLNQQQSQDNVKKDARMPETWSVKLPAYHHQSRAPAPKAATAPRKYPAQPSSIFRKSCKISSAAANFVSSSSSMEDDEDMYYLQEHREENFIEKHREEKKRWKLKFLP
eukprot:scaffold1034_cov127-Cylindrotheca_fusiformis.AAC.34